MTSQWLPLVLRIHLLKNAHDFVHLELPQAELLPGILHQVASLDGALLCDTDTKIQKKKQVRISLRPHFFTDKYCHKIAEAI